jgi:hypothetical protein
MPCCLLRLFALAWTRGWDVLRAATSVASARTISAGMDQPLIVLGLVAAIAFTSSIVALTWRARSPQAAALPMDPLAHGPIHTF